MPQQLINIDLDTLLNKYVLCKMGNKKIDATEEYEETTVSKVLVYSAMQQPGSNGASAPAPAVAAAPPAAAPAPPPATAPAEAPQAPPAAAAAPAAPTPPPAPAAPAAASAGGSVEDLFRVAASA